MIRDPGGALFARPPCDKFTQAIRTKLILEVAGREPMPRIRPASASAPRVSCTIGEDMWRQRMERYGP